MKIAIGSDHGGFKIKEVIRLWLKEKNIPFDDKGSFDQNSIDYPFIAHKVCKEIGMENSSVGILVCSSGQGMAITANKYRFIRAALCWNENIAELARQHNNANVLVLPGLYLTEQEAIKIVEVFLTKDFEGGRHQKRVEAILP